LRQLEEELINIYGILGKYNEKSKARNNNLKAYSKTCKKYQGI